MKGEKAAVHFVGAGPGAEDLITLRGINLLEQADVVIYAGSLVNPGLLKYCPGAEIHNSAMMTLDEVTGVIKKACEQGKNVVRLHTGDPSIFGAIKEQMDVLDELGICYDTCPGVSACFGAASSLNMEFTLPDVSQSLIITRMAGKTGVPPLESIRSFAAHRSTMAIYLSAAFLEELADELIAGGYEESTPVAIVYKATWPEEKKFICTIGTMAYVAEKNDIKKTAMIIVGDAVNNSGYSRSRLYADDFSTEFREAKRQV